jgi:hypothetical protein
MIMGSIEEEDFFATTSSHQNQTNFECEESSPSERDELLSISASSFKKGNDRLIESDSCDTSAVKSQRYRTASNEQQGLLLEDE